MPTATPIPPLSHPTTVIALNLARLAAMDPSPPHLTRLVGRCRALGAFSAFTRAMPPAALLTLTDQALYAALISHLAGIRFLARVTSNQRIAARPRILSL